MADLRFPNAVYLDVLDHALYLRICWRHRSDCGS